MIIEIKIPTPGESITEVELGKWLVEDGSIVEKNEEVAEIESDKATLTLVAEESGKISFNVQEGDTVEVGALACTIDTDAAGAPPKKAPSAAVEEKKEAPSAPKAEKAEAKDQPKIKTTAVAKEMMEEHHLSVDDIISGLQRIGKKEVEAVIHQPAAEKQAVVGGTKANFSRDLKRENMTMLRRKLSQRLVAVKNETAMLTTFNEVDMSPIMELRKKYQPKFVEKHGFKLGFMSFFTKAVAVAAQFHPAVNSMIDGDQIIEPQFVDVGIAVSTPKGLMVPIVRNAESKSIPAIELEIKELAEKARNKKISIEELTGGTFTITNGGVFGSLLSTPIINPPQSAILGMHNIVDRPVAVDGQVVIRPMMYVALSYDHRIIDGKDSVGFLVKIKELLENPQLLLTDGKAPEELLLQV
ncbi:2-oxoglutarate dehydrogenase complex dihydrolipoyllysine-residue succinyltransferase [Mangrovibacterium marinum]|uniref:Dihydrolipoyllysine-residue succinyltransferase n=1 Tax=Mangrovibacterium marinum TaxID=1639118 RepID=A0A2T5C3M5_9BACT|nr:2-oxoglutarate dehydrogenase complex dihydrolipoyllysine-residue succinyltransferase [Mangrovibacterium marinum]PTN09354.1 2-oxoglutarate dehydrogenase E2 component [Mangrovibacterium marinum]